VVWGSVLCCSCSLLLLCSVVGLSVAVLASKAVVRMRVQDRNTVRMLDEAGSHPLRFRLVSQRPLRVWCRYLSLPRLRRLRAARPDRTKRNRQTSADK
jgi:hypothetical protein